MTVAGPQRTTVSVVMPLRDEALIVRDAVGSLLDQELTGLDLEVLAVDGRSTDGTREILEELARGEPRLRVIDNPDRLTPHAMNRGLREAAGEYVCIFGSHTVYDRDYIAVCVEELERHAAAGCSGRVMVVPADGSRGAQLAAWTLSSSFASSGRSFRTAPEGYADTIPYPVFRRRALVELGGYNERLARNQDNDMNERLRAAGHALYLTWRTSCRYRAQRGVRALLRYAYNNGRWNLITVRENPRAMRLRHFMPLVFVVGAAGLVALAAALALLGAGPVLPLLVLTPLAAHLLLGTAAGVSRALRARRPLALLLPLVILAFHSSYGLGMLTALVRRARPPSVAHAASSAPEQAARQA
jgi:glycosyltransferase involved in cell wall biosynthesis